ncbi:hypothetical protein CF319_g6145 [Tilletia indica]|nr:hypothetical protein CF319_g6145 [Tilletia indica]
MADPRKKSSWVKLGEGTIRLVEAARDFQALVGDLKIDATVAGTLDHNGVDTGVEEAGKQRTERAEHRPELLPPLQAANADIQVWRSLEVAERRLVQAAEAFQEAQEELRVDVTIVGTLHQHGIDIRATPTQLRHLREVQTGHMEGAGEVAAEPSESSKRRKRNV